MEGEFNKIKQIINDHKDFSLRLEQSSIIDYLKIAKDLSGRV